MAKGSKKKERKPRPGDTVYLRGQTIPIAMLLVRVYVREGVEYGFCTWTTSHLNEQKELVHVNHEGEFLLENLTIVAPAYPTQIYRG